MKKFLFSAFCAFLIIASTLYSNKISDFIKEKISDNRAVILESPNTYAKNEGFKFVKISKDLIPYSYNDLLDALFTAINTGNKKVTFYCPEEYTDCLKDMEKISNDSLTLTAINNFVHPYNSFTNISTVIYESGEVTLNINHLYSEEQIKLINDEVDKIISQNYKESQNTIDNLKAIHDYIINTTKYDTIRSQTGDSQYESNTAYGTVLSHYATCNGYTDLMAIILSKLNIKNYKIATTSDRISYESKGHIWNAVYVNDSWLHLDLTWDDPVSESGEDYLYHKYFLVNNADLQKADQGDITIEEHNFDKSIYLEFNESINDIIS